MDKPKEPIKIIEFDKTTAQLHVKVETEGNLVSTADKNKKTGMSKSVLEQTIYKDGIQELIISLEEQKAKHEQGRDNAQAMLDGETTALDMINKDLKRVREVIGDLKFDKVEEKSDATPTPSS